MKKTEQKRKIFIASLNINSVKFKTVELAEIIRQEKVDVLCLQETKRKADSRCAGYRESSDR